MLDTFITFGYVAGAVGVVCSIIAYFAIPRMLKSLSESESEEG